MSESTQAAPAHRPWRADLLALLVVALLGAKAAVAGGGLRDLDMGDEDMFVVGAARLAETGLPPTEFSPLYALLDWVQLAIAPGDDIPYRNWVLLAVVLPCSVFVLARATGAGRFAALAVAGFIPATSFIDVWPYAMVFSACVIALGTAIAARLPRTAGFPVLGLSLWLACYARPEHLFALYGFLAVATVAFVIGLRRSETRGATLAAFGTFVWGGALLVAAFGSPLHSGSRLIVAFGQHYTQNRARAEGTAGADWVEDWKPRFRADFGDAGSVWAAVRSNPSAATWHVWENARRIPYTLSIATLPRVELTTLSVAHVGADVPAAHPKTVATTRWGLSLALAVGLFGAARGLRTSRELHAGGLVLLLLVPPMFAAVLVVYPRLHYGIPVLTICFALAAAGFRHLAPNARPGTRVTIALVVALALVVPNRAHGWCLQQYLLGANGGRIVHMPTIARDTVRTVRALELRGPIRFLDSSPIRQFYSGHGTDYVNALAVPPGARFDAFVRTTNVGILILDPDLLAVGPVLRDAPEVRALANGTESALFRLFPVERYPHTFVAVRRDLLPPEIHQ